MCLFVTLSVVAPGCKKQVSDNDIDVIGYKTLLQKLAPDAPYTVVVDVRRPEDFEKEHIPGAINIYLPDLRGNDPRLSRASNIVVYSEGYSDILSPAAAKRLIALNYVNVFDYRGGLQSWNDGGRYDEEFIEQFIEDDDPDI